MAAPVGTTALAATRPPRTAHRALRLVAVAVLIVLLFLCGIYDETIFAFLGPVWQKAATALGFSEQLARLQQSISGEVVKRSLPVVATYALLYLSLSLLLLRLLLPTYRLPLVLKLYGGVIAAYILLLLAGRLTGNVPWVYQLGRRLIDFLVSPLPIVILVSLLRWYRPSSRQ
ncbi:XrtX-associated membrane protein [Hymenobacter yonginensis]|uniref:Exosortase F system-associated protein n=1 Tax=Hymenobacter yonginensis TaxID=748197 RepID=A0ABY7PM10_9BACT|nr:hypothetical protein [Hymenobacter yonginensis]WBO83662.1 hypothetical protein O9Z63_14930 [Hymenobacter yonginensis]